MVDDFEIPEDILSCEDPEVRDFRWTAKLQRFCFHLARTGSSGVAEAEAGYTDGYGSTLVAKPAIQKLVQHYISEMLRGECESYETVMARWAVWANSDIGDYFDADWSLRDVSELTSVQRRRIKKVKIADTRYGRNIDFELYDAHRANNDLATALGVLKSQGDGEGETADEKAKSILEMLAEMDAVDGLTPPVQKQQVASEAGKGKPTTH